MPASCWANAVSPPAGAAYLATWRSKTTGNPPYGGGNPPYGGRFFATFVRRSPNLNRQIQNIDISGDNKTSVLLGHVAMLYQLHEMQRAFLRPLAAFTDASSQLFTHPYSPLAYMPMSRQDRKSTRLNS